MGRIQKIKCSGQQLIVYLPEQVFQHQNKAAAVYCLAGQEMETKLSEIVVPLEPCFGKELLPFILVLVPPRCWDDDFTPWVAPPVSGREKPFGGKADAFLDWLCGYVKPLVESVFSVNPSADQTGLVGYSLGGLAALYAAYRSLPFGRIGSVSGSLWYPGWVEYMSSHRFPNQDIKVYLSLGAKEERTKDPFMSQGGSAVRKAKDLLDVRLKPGCCKLEWNSGGHFSDTSGRIRKALAWMMENTK